MKLVTEMPRGAFGTSAGAPGATGSEDVRVDLLTDRDEAGRQEWTQFLSTHADATVFHEPVWCDSVRRIFGHATRTLLAREREMVTGVLPLMEVRGLLAGRRLVSMPYATGGGVLAHTDAARRALVRAAEQLAHGTGACLLELRGPGQERSGWTSVDRYVEFVRDLPANATDVERMLPRKARAAARQARDREGLTIRHDARDLNTVWNLYARSMRRLGSINYPRAFFADLGAGLGERTWVTTAWRGCRPVAGVVSFAERDTIRPYISGLDERLRCTGCTNLLYLAVMERAAACGMKRFDFGRTRRDNAGAMEFKRNQGFEPRDLTYAHYTPPGRKPLDLTPTNPRLASMRRVWPHLPLAITRPLGAWLARSIPG